MHARPFYLVVLLAPMLTGCFGSARRDCPTLPPAGGATPGFSVHSASVTLLYWKAGNTLHITPHGVPAGAPLQVRASSAEVLPSAADGGKFTIVPTGRNCVVTVDATIDGQRVPLGTRTFRVIKPPKPTLEVRVNNQPYNGLSPISKRSNVVIRVTPDSDFQAALPQDARYTINTVDLLVQRSLGAPTRVGSFSGSGRSGAQGVPVPLGNRLSADTPGAKIYFRVDRVYRVNFKGQNIEEDLSDLTLSPGAVIR